MFEKAESQIFKGSDYMALTSALLLSALKSVTSQSGINNN